MVSEALILIVSVWSMIQSKVSPLHLVEHYHLSSLLWMCEVKDETIQTQIYRVIGSKKFIHIGEFCSAAGIQRSFLCFWIAQWGRPAQLEVELKSSKKRPLTWFRSWTEWTRTWQMMFWFESRHMHIKTGSVKNGRQPLLLYSNPQSIWIMGTLLKRHKDHSFSLTLFDFGYKYKR